jgi:hypothetical protein
MARMGEKRNTYKILGGNPVRICPSESLRRRWEENINQNIKNA